MNKRLKIIWRVAFALVLLSGAVVMSTNGRQLTRASNLFAQDNDNKNPSRVVLTRRLQDRNASVRQNAAEEVARLAAVDMLKLIEGFRREEKNDRVQLAMDWALYRLGKLDRLFYVVRALDTSRADQAKSYLADIESPEPLYKYLDGATKHKTQIRLLEILARVGDEQTLTHLDSYAKSSDKKIARAAQAAQTNINQRLKSTQSPANAKRPRKVS